MAPKILATWTRLRTTPSDALTLNASEQKRTHQLVDPWLSLPRPLSGWAIAVLAPVLTALATAAGLAMSSWIPRHSVDLLYLLAVVLAATGLGTRMGLAVAVMSFLTYNFFFLHPLLDFSIAHTEDVFALGVLLIVAAIAGSLAGRLRAAHDAARRRTQALQSLNEFAALLSGTRDVEDILRDRKSVV